MKREFKGIWIPADIWLSKELSLQEKVFLVEIDSLDNEDGCFASNKYFAEFFQLSKGRVSQVITGLLEKKYITAKYVKKEKLTEKRILKINHGVFRKLNTPIKNPKGGYLENDKENNTLINNTINKTLQDKPARSEKEKKAFKRVWELFEEHSGKPIPKYEGSLQSKSIWEMIDKAKESDADWAEYLGRVINAFFDIIKNKPKGLECVYNQQVKPHILNGVKIWMRVVNKLPDNTPVRTELTVHEEYRIRNGFV